MIDFSGNVKIDGRYGTWYEIDRSKASDGREYILFESEQYGDETACILCILPKDNEVKKMVGKKTGTEYVVIPHEFEVEETYDDINTALEQDLGLEVLDEDIDLEKEDVEVIEEALDVSEDERDSILSFFRKQKNLWSNYPDIIDERYVDDAYEVEMDNSNPTYLADTRESLMDLCQKIAPDLGFDIESNDNGFYGKTYIFYHTEEDDLTESVDAVNEEKGKAEEQKIELEADNAIQIDDDLSAHYEGALDVDSYYANRDDRDNYGGVSFSVTSKSNPDIDNNLFINFIVGEDDIDLEYGTDTWDDPGDYPSGAGGGPLASYDYEVIEDGTLNLKKDDLMDCVQYEWDGYFVDDKTASEKSGLSIDALAAIAEKVTDRAYKGLVDDGVPVLVEYLADHYEG